MLIYEAKEKRMSFLKFKLRPMFTEPARAKELHREIIPLPKETSPPSNSASLSQAVCCLLLMAPFSDKEGCHSLKRAKVVLDLSAWQKKT